MHSLPKPLARPGVLTQGCMRLTCRARESRLLHLNPRVSDSSDLGSRQCISEMFPGGAVAAGLRVLLLRTTALDSRRESMSSTRLGVHLILLTRTSKSLEGKQVGGKSKVPTALHRPF